MDTLTDRGDCVLIGIFGLDGLCIELPRTIPVGYYFGLPKQDRLDQVPRIIAVVLDVISVFVSSVERPPQ